MLARGAVKRLSSPCRRITRASERRRDMCASPCAAAVANITATFDDVKDIFCVRSRRAMPRPRSRRRRSGGRNRASSSSCVDPDECCAAGRP